MCIVIQDISELTVWVVFCIQLFQFCIRISLLCWDIPGLPLYIEICQNLHCALGCTPTEDVVRLLSQHQRTPLSGYLWISYYQKSLEGNLHVFYKIMKFMVHEHLKRFLIYIYSLKNPGSIQPQTVNIFKLININMCNGYFTSINSIYELKINKRFQSLQMREMKMKPNASIIT